MNCYCCDKKFSLEKLRIIEKSYYCETCADGVHPNKFSDAKTHHEQEEIKAKDKKLPTVIIVLSVIFLIYKYLISGGEASIEYEKFFPVEMINIESKADLQLLADGWSGCELIEKNQNGNYEFSNTYVSENGYFTGVKFAIEIPNNPSNSGLKNEFDACTKSFQTYIEAFNKRQLAE